MTPDFVHMLKATGALMVTVAFASFGQNTSLGVRYTYQLQPHVFVDNPSPSNIFGPRQARAEKEIFISRYFYEQKWGAKLGLQLGSIPFSLGIDGPRDAFGNGSGAGQQVNSIYTYNDFVYHGATISAVRRIDIGGRYLDIAAGITARDYVGSDGNDGIGLALNRSEPYDPDNPAHQPPDVYAELKSLADEFHINFPFSLDYVFQLNKRSNLKVGIMYNFAIRPMADSELTVYMYGVEYKGKFSPRSSFLGANVAIDYSFRKKTSLPRTPSHRITQKIDKYRKSLYVERHGNGVFASANFDTRVARNVNDGFGVRAGLGIGDDYWATVVNNNKSTLVRALSLPLGVNYIVGKNRHGLEAGVGYTAQIPINEVREGYPRPRQIFVYHFGYRYQPKADGLVARVAWAPVTERWLGWSTTKYILYNTAISLGYSFR